MKFKFLFGFFLFHFGNYVGGRQFDGVHAAFGITHLFVECCNV